MRTNEPEFIEKIGKIVEVNTGKAMVLIVADELVFIEAPYFTYNDIQKFVYLLTRTPCEWYIYPSTRITNGVQLKVRLF